MLKQVKVNPIQGRRKNKPQVYMRSYYIPSGFQAARNSELTLAAPGGDDMENVWLRGNQGEHSMKGTWVPPVQAALGLHLF